MNNDEFESIDDLSEHANIPKVLINNQNLIDKKIVNIDNKNNINQENEKEKKIDEELIHSIEIKKDNKNNKNIIFNKKNNVLSKSHIINSNKKNFIQKKLENNRAINSSKIKNKLNNNNNTERNSLDTKFHLNNKLLGLNHKKNKMNSIKNLIKKEFNQNIIKMKSTERKSEKDYRVLKNKESLNVSNKKNKKNINSKKNGKSEDKSTELIINKEEKNKLLKIKNQNKLKDINIKKINNLEPAKSVEITNTTINQRKKIVNKFGSLSIKEININKNNMEKNNIKDKIVKNSLINNYKRNSNSTSGRNKINKKNKYKNFHLIKKQNLNNNGNQTDNNNIDKKKNSINLNNKQNNKLLKSYEKKETKENIKDIYKNRNDKYISVKMENKNNCINKTVENKNLRVSSPNFNISNKENQNQNTIKNEEEPKENGLIINHNSTPKKEKNNSNSKINESQNTSSSKKVRIKYKVIKIDKINFVKEFDCDESQNIKLYKHLSKDKNTLLNNFKSQHGLSKPGKDQLGRTKINQDSYIILTKINNIKEFNIFGVLDGHGPDGHLISQFISKYIQHEFQMNPLLKNIKDIEQLYEKLISEDFEIIKNIFINADNALRDEEIDSKNGGTTCVLVIHLGFHIICANVGDSRGILVFDEKNDINLNNLNVFPLSIDNKPENPKEKERICKMGGIVEQIKNLFGQGIGPFRVWAKNKDYPGLAMSRSLGDFNGKNIGIIPDPEIIECNLSIYCKYIVICSDGVWEFLNNKEVMNIGKKFYLENNPRAFCKELIEKSTKFWEKHDAVIDDITVVAIFF